MVSFLLAPASSEASSVIDAPKANCSHAETWACAERPDFDGWPKEVPIGRRIVRLAWTVGRSFRS